MSTRENIRLIARTPLFLLVYKNNNQSVKVSNHFDFTVAMVKKNG